MPDATREKQRFPLMLPKMTPTRASIHPPRDAMMHDDRDARIARLSTRR